MENLVIYLITSFSISFLLFPLFIKILENKKVFEQFSPRKIHNRYVPGFGGVPIIVSALLTAVVFLNLEELAELKFLFFSILFVFIIGLRDDILPLSAIIKAVNQVIPGIIVFFFFDIRIDTFFTLGHVELPIYLSLPLTCFTIVIITNSFNLIDGIDGLAGILAIISLSVFASFFYISGNHSLSFLLSAFIGSLCGFLYYNIPPAKIFMGDTGALIIGFLISCSAIVFMQSNFNSVNNEFNGIVGTAIAIIGVPLFDTFRIIIIRLKSGRSPLSADRNHVHHMLIDLGWTHGGITAAFGVVQLISVAFVLYFKGLNDLIIFLFLGLLYFTLLFIVWKKLKSKTQKAGI